MLHGKYLLMNAPLCSYICPLLITRRHLVSLAPCSGGGAPGDPGVALDETQTAYPLLRIVFSNDLPPAGQSCRPEVCMHLTRHVKATMGADAIPYRVI